jgi:hypothetical protein
MFKLIINLCLCTALSLSQQQVSVNPAPSLYQPSLLSSVNSNSNLAIYNNLYVLDLNNSNAIPQIMDYIKKYPNYRIHLKVLHLHDNVVHDFLRFLKGYGGLVALLDLSDNHDLSLEHQMDMAMGLDHVPYVEILNLNNMNWRGESVSGFQLSLPNLKKLRILDVGDNHFKTSFFSQMKNIVKHFKYDHGHERQKEITALFAHLPNLEELYCIRMGLRDDGMDGIINSLAQLKNLKKLYVGRNSNVTNSIKLKLVQSLKLLPNLQELDLLNLDFNGATADAFIQLIPFVPQLSVVKLGWFEDIDSNKITQLLQTLSTLGNLTVLDLIMSKDQDLDIVLNFIPTFKNLKQIVMRRMDMKEAVRVGEFKTTRPDLSFVVLP